jgi:dTDP-4-amino-4,6-dideoxygalactose transaminase
MLCKPSGRLRESGVMIPPVRRPVPLHRGDPAEGRREFSSFFPGREVHLYDSGTTALALALQDARLRHGSIRPEAILPAYGCPQLVSACLHASVRPRLIDSPPGQWGYDPPQLLAALSPDTVAVVAVNLLGAGDQAQDLVPVVHGNGSLLIQDSAQYLPPRGAADWHGDYVVLSFGRGKPLNLLRGGALAVRADRPLLADASRATGARARIKEAALASRAAALAFNVSTHSKVFWLTSKLPGLGLSGTTYEAVHSVAAASSTMWGELGPAFETYSREHWESPWAGLLPEWEQLGIRSLTTLTTYPRQDARRLRWALLASDPQQREQIVATLNQNGLGASRMYVSILGQVSDIPAEVAAQGPFPNATWLADRLFTLPTHGSVTADIVARTDRCLRAVVAQDRGYEPALHP